jgi:hypothetical protein
MVMNVRVDVSVPLCHVGPEMEAQRILLWEYEHVPRIFIVLLVQFVSKTRLPYTSHCSVARILLNENKQYLTQL